GLVAHREILERFRSRTRTRTAATTQLRSVGGSLGRSRSQAPATAKVATRPGVSAAYPVDNAWEWVVEQTSTHKACAEVAQRPKFYGIARGISVASIHACDRTGFLGSRLGRSCHPSGQPGSLPTRLFLRILRPSPSHCHLPARPFHRQ